MRRIPRTHQREAGSVYVIALLVLLILTIVGLALSLVTQTERLLGANDRITQRVFYAADSGTAVSTARPWPAPTAPISTLSPSPSM